MISQSIVLLIAPSLNNLVFINGLPRQALPDLRTIAEVNRWSLRATSASLRKKNHKDVLGGSWTEKRILEVNVGVKHFIRSEHPENQGFSKLGNGNHKQNRSQYMCVRQTDKGVHPMG